MSKEYTPFKMKEFSGFGNSPAKQNEDKPKGSETAKEDEKTPDWFAEDKRTDAEKKADQEAFDKMYPDFDKQFETKTDTSTTGQHHNRVIII